MQPDTPNASWHPAMMPDSDVDTRPTTEQDEIPSQPSPIPTFVGDDTPQPTKQTEGLDLDPIHETTLLQDEEPSKDGAFLDQFNHRDDSVATGWDISEPLPAIETNAGQGQATASDDGEIAQTGPEPASTRNTAKHSSAMSFARTVSHEMSFNDDEDVEWSFQRTETDPFKFMPPNERTNSFPKVPPPAENTTEDQIDDPISSNQVQEILHDIEQQEARIDDGDPPAFPGPFGEGQQSADQAAEDAFFQQAVGGDLMGAEEETSDARFEEGLPLISQQEPQITEPSQDDDSPKPDDPFAQDDEIGGGDDFFSQVHDGPRPVEQNPFEHGLQRKSTTMVIGKAMAASLDSEPPTPIEKPVVESADSDLPAQEHVNGDEAAVTNEETLPSVETKSEDIDAKWAAAFGDDDDDGFLLESAVESKELDPADIFGSDDEGFLEDNIEETPSVPAPVASVSQPSVNGRYTPQTHQGHPQPTAQNLYAPTSSISQSLPSQYPSYAQPVTAPPVRSAFAPHAPRPEIPKAQSFASKSKGGYQSPYDLPMEVVKPKKRVSMQQVPRTSSTLSTPPPVAPPRSASLYAQPSPPVGSSSLPSPPNSGQSNQPLSIGEQKHTPQLKSKGSFFEDLPMTSKQRPTSRQSSLGSPTQQGPQGQSLPPRGPPQGPRSMAQSNFAPEQAAVIPALVAPDRPRLYAQSQSVPNVKPPNSTGANTRYSPAPPAVNGAEQPPPASGARYSPAPPTIRSSSSGYSNVPPPAFQHLPRNSSPLAQFEVSSHRDHLSNKLPSPTNSDGASLGRSHSSQYEPRVTRVPSLPPTQEVEEDLPPVGSPPMTSTATSTKPASETRHTPPPPSLHPSSTLSPPKRSTSSYAPQPATAAPHKEVSFVPPLRSQTQSPGALYGNRMGPRPVDPVSRPSSVQGASSARGLASSETSRPSVRTRGMSQHLNLVPPSDGRELDPLQRWRGCPSITWGVGGLLVTSFPQDVPRYGIGQALPQIIRSPGEVKVKHIKDVQALEERLAKFPGPLKGKSKKRETLAWLTAGIEGLERALPNVSFQQYVLHEDKRAIERTLLWKILKVFIENDGVLEGNDTVNKAVREIISPDFNASSEIASTAPAGVDLISPVAATQADAVDSTTVEVIRRHLLAGDREKAVWTAVDKRLWGHAMLISNTLQSAELYKQVTQEFIKKEVNHPGQGNESLAALYGVLSSNFEESVDALVPIHARAGLQLMSTSPSTTASQDALAGLDKWRETLGMILSNRSSGDAQALLSLGNLLSGYGRAEAAHICYIFARTHAIFGGLDDPNAHFVLVGADHKRQADQFAKETEPLQLSEVYEYGLTLTGGSNASHTCPHLAAYKLQHAMTLAEYGFRDKALQYSEGIYNAITAQTKRSPYYHPILESSVDDLMRRLKQAPREESSSWIAKPTMNQVSNNMWSRFNKFVAGDDDTAANGAAGSNGVQGSPFAGIPSGSPTISRPSSTSNFETYGAGIPASYTPVIVANNNKSTSRYAPMTSQGPASPQDSVYAPRTSMERTSSDIPRRSYESQRQGSNMNAPYSNPYAPAAESSVSLPSASYLPAAAAASPYAPGSQESLQHPAPQEPAGDSLPGYQPYSGTQEPPKVDSFANEVGSNPAYQAPSFRGYEPPSFASSVTQPEATAGGYEPPSSYQPSGFEPPSYQPELTENDDGSEAKPKKKSFMDDDDDDIPGLRTSDKPKSDKDRENEEMFRKVAEEEAKRAAEQEKAKAAGKKGWGFGGWFGSGSKKESLDQPQQPNKAIRAKLGENSSFIYDPDLKRWVNKKPGAENTPTKTATPPPPRLSVSRNGTPPPPMSASAPPPSGPVGPPSARATPPPPLAPSGLSKAVSAESLGASGLAIPMMRTVSGQSTASAPGGPPSALPPSRPPTSLSNASSIDDLMGAAGSNRRPGIKKPRKSSRYVDVMAK